MSKSTLDVLRGALILARHLELDDIADSLERHIECLEHQEQVRADRAALAARRVQEAGAQIYMAPRGTEIHYGIIDEIHDWKPIGYLSEDGITFQDIRQTEDDYHHVRAAIERANRQMEDDYYWRTLVTGDKPHHAYGLPDHSFGIVERPRQAGKTTGIRALREILERNPAAAAEHRRKP